MIGTLAKAGFSYIFRFVSFIFLALAINIGLLITYFDTITALFRGEGVTVGVITLATIIIFPIIWIIIAKQSALLVALFKVIDSHKEGLIGFLIDTFLTKGNKTKVANFNEKLAEQSWITQLILNFFLEQVDFFGDVQRLMSEKNYTNQELKVKMVEALEEKEIYEEWKPSFWIPILLILSNIGVVVLAVRFLG